MKALLKYAPRAAKQAALAGSHREAAAHLLTALRHADSLGAAERARLLQLHATERDLTNETSIDAATQALDLWRELGDVAAQAQVLLLLSWQYWKAGQKALADQEVAAAIALLQSLPESRELAMAHCPAHPGPDRSGPGSRAPR